MIEVQEEKRSAGPMVLAAIAALLLTTIVFGGYTLLRKRHAETGGSLSASAPVTEAPKQPKALVLVDEAMNQGGTSTIAGTVKNTSNETLQQVVVELELKRRKDAVTETKLLALNPTDLQPEAEGRYALQLRVQDYSFAKLVGLKVGAGQLPLAYTSAQGQKRPLERLESKTVVVGAKQSPGKKGEFLNSPDNPARVP